MATGTRPDGLDMIDQSIVAPGRGLVAALTKVRRYRMRLRLAGSGHRIVAADTRPRCVLEACVDVTRSTGDAEMRTGQRKSGRGVIE